MLGRKYVTISTIPWKDGTVTPTGARVTVTFIQSTPYLAEIWFNDSCHRIHISRLHRLLKGFPKPPSISALTKMATTGVARSVLGKRVEPDGWDTEGAPSWLLAEEAI